jgi:hypothetical protein
VNGEPTVGELHVRAARLQRGCNSATARRAGPPTAIAAIILVPVALTGSAPAALGPAVMQFAYQQVENSLVYPIVHRRAVAPPALDRETAAA